MKRASTSMGDENKAEGIYYGEDVIDLREYLSVISKWRWVIILLTLCAVITSGIISFFVLNPVYETKAVLMVAQAASTTANRNPATQDNLESVVNSMSSIPQLTMNTYVSQVKNSALMGLTLESLQEKSVEKAKNLSPGSLAGMIEALSIKDTNLIEIKVSNTNPELTAEIANTHMQEFLDFISNNNQTQMRKSMDFLKTQIDVEEKNLEAASTELQKLQGEPRNLIFLQNGIEGKYIDLNKYQSLANQARYEYQQTLAGRNSLRERLIEVPATIIVNSTDSTDPREEINPAYESLNEALIRKEMDLAEKTAQLESALGISLILESEIRTLQAEASEKKLTMDRLQDTLDRSKKTFNLLNEKWTQTQIIQAVNTGETYLIPVSPASVPTSPVKPKKMLNMTIAGILGLMASIMLAFVLEFLDNTVKDADDIQKIFNLPVIGNIPVIDDLDQEPKNRNDRQKLGHGEENYPWSKAIT